MSLRGDAIEAIIEMLTAQNYRLESYLKNESNSDEKFFDQEDERFNSQIISAMMAVYQKHIAHFPLESI